jgi:SAM-dependent methyltransferase
MNDAKSRRRRASLAEGATAHYVDPKYYSSAYRDRTNDVDYYLTLALERDGTVLEYGCGNGRIALPVANAGVYVTGIDRSRAMLADLRAKLGRSRPEVRARVSIHRGDMRRVVLGRRFDLVLCTFNTFLHLYSRRDVERFLARAREHMARGGRFVVDVSMPSAEELARDPKRLHRTPRFRHGGTGEVVRYGERFDYDPLTQVQMVDMVFEPVDRPRARWVSPLAHRQFFPQELEALLHYNGLTVVERHGDFVRKPPTRDSEMLIYHCRKR